MAFSIGTPMAVLVSSGAFAGHWLDSKWGTEPWLTLSGVVLGSVAGFVNMFRVLKWWQRRSYSAPPKP
jgi:ATP synthase protein I